MSHTTSNFSFDSAQVHPSDGRQRGTCRTESTRRRVDVLHGVTNGIRLYVELIIVEEVRYARVYLQLRNHYLLSYYWV